ncbi:MAG: DUF2911 domain-containing protein [Bacteroidota bacterium]
MRSLLPALLGLALASGAAAQHSHSVPASGDDPHAVAETFVVDGFRIDNADPPPGSAVGRAGLRYTDGGYVSVVHGKPYARGRTIWGGVVGFGQVWAAGAHRATELVTTVPLRISQARVEPGAYSLFITPHHNAWTLHVNASLGMHLADEYDPALDVARVDIVPDVLLAPVEGLTWSFRRDGAFLTLAWDRFGVDIPLARADALPDQRPGQAPASGG